jgi:uncharacterized membrane protein
MSRIFGIIAGIASLAWFFYYLGTSISKSPIVSFTASLPVWLVMVVSILFFFYDAYDHIKKLKK